MDNIMLCDHCTQPNSIYDTDCVRCGYPLNHERLILNESQNWN